MYKNIIKSVKVASSALMVLSAFSLVNEAQARVKKDRFPIPPVEEPQPETHFSEYYSEDAHINLDNLDRGMYKGNISLTVKRSWDAFTSAKEDGFIMVYAPLDLSLYRTQAILPEELFEIVEDNFVQAKEAGVKIIFRVIYRDGSDSVDASREIVETHLNQMESLLQKHKDVISIVQAGVIGAYGEWHAFSGDYAEENSNYLENRRAVIERLNTIFPDKFIQIRTTMHKEEVFGDSKYDGDPSTAAQITEEIAFSDDIRAKVGHHNDCFVSSYSDYGTFDSANPEFWRAYMENDAQFAPVGGETCDLKEGEEGALSSCENVLLELDRFNYAYLNGSYNPDVMAKWKEEGCYESIKENLGYRFVAQQLDVTQESEQLTLQLHVTNRGYSAPYINYDVSFILKNESNEYSVVLDEMDLRRFKPSSQKIIELAIDTSDKESGNYCLYIKIGKELSQIKLSNVDIWDEQLEANRLTCKIEIE